jgi:hypothetical protein
LEYVKDIFLMIGNFLYPSKTNEVMESAIYTMPPKYFSKYKNHFRSKTNLDNFFSLKIFQND